MKIIKYQPPQETKATIMVDDKDLLGYYPWNEAIKQIEWLNSIKYKGYGNWRLPDKEELSELYEQRSIIGGFSSSYYWSRTERSNSSAWNQYFNDGRQYSYDKSCYYRVRCVRDV